MNINQNHITTHSAQEAVQAPALSLVVPSLPIRNFASGLAELISIMHPIMSTKDGIGLAAPQIGHNVQVVLLDKSLDRFDKNALSHALTDHGYALINPQVLSRSEDKVDLYRGEGCLSLENAIPGKVERHKSITLRYQNVKGEVFTEELSAHIATIVQHEIDHLYGILYPARMKESDAKMLWAKYVKDLRLGVNQVLSFTKLMEKNLARFEKNLCSNEFNMDDFRAFAHNISIANEQIDELIKRAVHCGA